MARETDVRRTHAPAFKVFVFWALGIAAILGVISFAAIALRPAWLGFERAAFVSSHQYIESKRTAILNDLVECRKLPEGAHKAAMRDRIFKNNASLKASDRVSGDC